MGRTNWGFHRFTPCCENQLETLAGSYLVLPDSPAVHLQWEQSRPSTCTIYRTAPHAHLLPVKPLAHWHCPVSGSHLPLLWHTHSSAQFGPNRPSGHRSVQTDPCRKVRGKTGRDAEKMQMHHFKKKKKGKNLEKRTNQFDVSLTGLL